MIHIIPTTNTEHLTKDLDQKKFKVIYLDKNKDNSRYFPDKEVFVSLSNFTKRDPDESQDDKSRVVVLHSGMPLPNRGLVELEMVLAFLKAHEMKNVEVFFSYFAYGMQDKQYNYGEVNAAENIIKKLVDYYNVKKVFILDPHFHGAEWIPKYPIIEISSVEKLKESALKDYPDAIFIAPDGGSQKRTKLKGGEKTRNNSHDVDCHHDGEFGKSIKGCIVGVVDDIIETGGTMSRFADKCREYETKDVIAIATHGVLPEGIKRISESYSKLYLTNSIDQPEANVDVRDIIFDAIENKD